MTWRDNGPIGALVRQGLEEPIWAKREALLSSGEYSYITRYLSQRNLIPLAHLIADGWDCYVDANGPDIRIKIYPLNPNQKEI